MPKESEFEYKCPNCHQRIYYPMAGTKVIVTGEVELTPKQPGKKKPTKKR